ncbi:SNF2 super family protein [Colletotrichum scovillei]|uniref:SNF2 super family protein n=1 Tax=Colletotrichum scovillei TaxID=1209932 RepID=UPI0015C3213A|nr:SNF2 super family protein [Colletotrichum scovillei]KAF4783429.1 SNF2 super family protein [Colletotrichum scovillei]
MEGNEDDPFDWDVERLVHELCTAESRPWHPKLASKRPNPATLSKALREHDIDGETLLTYEDVMPPLDGLLRDLGIVKIVHKMTIVKAINYLKSKSHGYRHQKIEVAKEEAGSQESSLELHINGKPEPAALNPSTTEDPPTTITTQDVTMHGTTDQGALASVVEEKDMQTSQPPQKKRKMAPTLITSTVTGIGNIPIRTPADDVVTRKSMTADTRLPLSNTTPSGSRGRTPPAIPAVTDDAISRELVKARVRPSPLPVASRKIHPDPQQVDQKLVSRSNPLGAYFGPDAFIISRQVPQSSLAPGTSSADEGRNTFHFVARGLIPTGHSRQVHRALRRLLRMNDKSLILLRNGMSPFVEPEEEDEILPVFGDSDDDEGYDTETRDAIEEEEEEKKREMELKSHHLTSDDVERVLKEEIQRIEASWEERKLIKKYWKANAIWNKARRTGLVRQIASATSRLEALNNRIEKLCREIKLNEWPAEDQLRRQARCLESSVEDRSAEKWLLDTLRGPEPIRPLTMPKQRPIAAPRPDLSDEDGDLITSGDDDDDDDFVIDDEEGVDDMANALPPVASATRPAGPMDLDDPEEVPMQGPQPPRLLKDESPADAPVDMKSDLGIIDLTMVDSEPEDEPENEPAPPEHELEPALPEADFISLVTPEKPRASAAATPAPESDGEEQPQPTQEQLETPFDQYGKIGDIAPTIWRKQGDNKRLLICVISRLTPRWRVAFFRIIHSMDPADIWTDFVITALEDSPQNHSQESAVELGTVVARLFRVFALCKPAAANTITRRLTNKIKARKIKGKVDQFEDFCQFVKTGILPNFPEGIRASSSDRRGSFDTGESQGDFTDDDIEDSPAKKRKTLVAMDQTAMDLRESDRRRREEQEQRRKELRKKLAASDTISSDKSRLIINETKGDDEGLIYINSEIGQRIKDHQIEGVRFLWNQIVYDAKVRQGCLLAHTMGLGKTMQVITLLVAIAEAARSKDESVLSQIPEDLRQSKTLVLCPALLVDNWMDELLMWAPDGVLGHFYKMEAVVNALERAPMIREWDKTGGVMIIGYDMFKRLAVPSGDEMLTPLEAKSIAQILTESPNLVVADEAHKMKNPESMIAIAAAKFKTQRRIALTGSPLANNVIEFYCMINWVAPNYLGPLAEFKDYYAEPIQSGLYEDSTGSQYRKAKKQLAVLEATVAPKTNRATIKSCLKNDLPPKMEFVLTVPMTPLQGKLYDAFLDALNNDANVAGVKTLGANINFSLIVNHPRCWQKRLLEERAALLKKEPASLTLSSTIISEGLKILQREQDVPSPALSWKVQLLVGILDQCIWMNEKVLVFSQSIPTLDYLDNLFRQQKRKFSRLDGSTPIHKRQQQVKNFNSGENQVYLISTTAGGVGLNIHGASRVVIFDYKYNPIHEQQAVGRAYRIGQRKPVYVYKFISGGTYEQALHNRNVFKTQLASRVVDSENPKRWSKKDNEYAKTRWEPDQDDLSPFAGKDVVLDSLLTHPGMSQGIRSIIMTDTFEEEDTSEILTPEDLKDVKNQVYMNSIRNTDPEKYREMELARIAKLGAPALVGATSYMPQTVTQTFGVAGSSSQTPIPTPNLPQRPVFNTYQAFHPVEGLKPLPDTMKPPQITPVPVPVPGALATHIDAAPTQQAAAPLQLNQPATAGSDAQTTEQPAEQISVEPQVAGPMPMPMAGANTFFRAQQTPSSPPPGDKSLSSPAVKRPKRPGITNWEEQFKQKILESLDTITDSAIADAVKEDKTVLADRIASSTWLVRSEMKEGELPNHSHMKELCSLMTEPRFAAAVITGHIPPSQLAYAPIDGLKNLSNELTTLQEHQFREKLKLGQDTTEEPKQHPQIVSDIPKPSPNVRRANPFQEDDDDDDLDLLREVAERRRHRAPRLPTWASKAVEEGKLGEQRRTGEPSLSTSASASAGQGL